MAQPDLDVLLATALEAAGAAARVHAGRAGPLDPSEISEKKGSSNFVSRVDLEAQDAALAVIRDRHPDHRIMAEEDEEEVLAAFPAGADAPEGDGGDGPEVVPNEPRAGSFPPVWIVDPLDGTTNFLHGFPMYASSVAVAAEGRPVAGAVVSAPTGERWWAARDRGAWKDRRGTQGALPSDDAVPVRVSPVRDLSRALVGTGFPFKVPDVIPGYLDQLGRALRASSGVRRGGSAALDLCYLASGTLDAFWELYLNPWDVAAGVVILEEAGGVVSRMDGSPLSVERAGSVLAANSRELLRALGDLVRGDDGPPPSA